MDSANTAGDIKGKQFLGFLKGHKGEVTSMVSGNSGADASETKIFISGSRDKTILIWKLNASEGAREGELYGEPFMALKGHSHFVSDLVLSKENTYLLSSSWDKTVRLWDVKTGVCNSTFLGSDKELTSVAVSNDLRKVYTAGLEENIWLWNTKGKRMESSKQSSNHQDWVSKVRASPSNKNDFLASAGWDGKLKIWLAGLQLKASFVAHEGPIDALAISTNGMFLATGGRDGYVKTWRFNSLQDALQVIRVDSNVNDIAFNPNFRIYAVATEKSVSVFSLEQDVKEPKTVIKIDELKTEDAKTNDHFGKFTSVCWSADGTVLYSGTASGIIAAHKIEIS